MSRFKKLLYVLMFVLSMTGPAYADILWDYSPDTTGAQITPYAPAGNWANTINFQYFVEQVNFSQDVSLTGMDTYSANWIGHVGTQASIVIYSNLNNLPNSLLFNFTETINLVDTDGTSSLSQLNRKHADFTNDVLLSAGTYWIGMTGALGNDICQASLINVVGGDGQMAEFYLESYYGIQPIGDMAFRLEGENINIAPVPEPATMFLLGSGLFGLAGFRKRFLKK